MATHSAADKQRIYDLFSRVHNALSDRQIPSIEDLVTMQTLALNYEESATEFLKGLRNYEKKSSTIYSTTDLIKALQIMEYGEQPNLTNQLIMALNGYLKNQHNASGVFGKRTTKVLRGQSWQLDGFIKDFIHRCRYKIKRNGKFVYSQHPITRKNIGKVLSKSQGSSSNVYIFCAELSAACLDNRIDAKLADILDSAGLSLHESYFRQLTEELCNEIAYLRSIDVDEHNPQELRTANRWRAADLRL